VPNSNTEEQREMTKEKAWDNFVTQLNNFGWYFDRILLKTAWEVSWYDAHKTGFKEGRVTKMIDGPEYAAQDYTKAPYKYTHVRYGYEFVVSPNGNLVVKPVGVNEK